MNNESALGHIPCNFFLTIPTERRNNDVSQSEQHLDDESWAPLKKTLDKIKCDEQGTIRQLVTVPDLLFTPAHTEVTAHTPLFVDASPRVREDTGIDESSCNKWRLEAHTSTPEGDVSLTVTTSMKASNKQLPLPSRSQGHSWSSENYSQEWLLVPMDWWDAGQLISSLTLLSMFLLSCNHWHSIWHNPLLTVAKGETVLGKCPAVSTLALAFSPVVF